MERVLFVDDQKHIRQELCEFLRTNNYAVHSASTIEEAKKIIKSEELDYAIIDLKLDATSEFGGVKLVNFAKRNQPGLQTIVLSAYPFEDVEQDLENELKDEIDSRALLHEIKMDYISKGGEKNYIEAVLLKLKDLSQIKQKKKCFVVMPFSTTKSCEKKEWDEIFEKHLKPAVEETGLNYQCSRANLLQGEIIANILDNLNRADLVIADLTDMNPNVLYELGVRHTLGGPTILITQNEEDVPFDLKPYMVPTYRWKLRSEQRKFRKMIKNAIASIEKAYQTETSPIHRYLNP